MRITIKGQQEKQNFFYEQYRSICHLTPLTLLRLFYTALFFRAIIYFRFKKSYL